MMTALEYWRSGAGLPHLTPQRREHPEGPGFEQTLIAMTTHSDVVEFGCGEGRLAQFFVPHRYLGLDICPEAIRLAKLDYPAHEFREIGRADAIESADTILAHTVMLHIPDADLEATVARMQAPRVIVSEILGRRHRSKGFPPVFNREAPEYRDAFRRAGYRQTRRIDVPYDYYPNEFLSFLEFKSDDGHRPPGEPQVPARGRGRPPG